MVLFIKQHRVFILICLCIIIQFLSVNTVRGKQKQRLQASEAKHFFAHLQVIIDGDSFVVTRNGSNMSIRLWGIDAPEFDQPHSQASKDALDHLISGRTLRIILKDIDKYGRIVAVVHADQINVNRTLVASGNVWVHDYFCKKPVCQQWYELQQQAQRQKTGLWQGENVIEPWVWKMKK